MVVGDFRAGRLEGWEAKVFHGETRYRIVEREPGKVLEGFSQGTASGLLKPAGIDLRRHPFLHWSWRATGLLEGNDERRKAGDDYPLRLFVLVPDTALFGDPRAINYVWSRNQPPGSSWPNPHTANATMVVVESGPARLNRWVSYKRDLRADLRRYLGLEADRTLAVALMVDTDNTGQQARSYFGDIYFSAR